MSLEAEVGRLKGFFMEALDHDEVEDCADIFQDSDDFIEPERMKFFCQISISIFFLFSISVKTYSSLAFQF